MDSAVMTKTIRCPDPSAMDGSNGSPPAFPEDARQLEQRQLPCKEKGTGTIAIAVPDPTTGTMNQPFSRPFFAGYECFKDPRTLYSVGPEHARCNECPFKQETGNQGSFESFDQIGGGPMGSHEAYPGLRVWY